MTVLVSEHTARKPHHCTNCKGTIQPGQRYVRHAMTPNDPEFDNPRWWVLVTHAGDCFRYADEP